MRIAKCWTTSISENHNVVHHKSCQADSACSGFQIRLSNLSRTASPIRLTWHYHIFWTASSTRAVKVGITGSFFHIPQVLTTYIQIFFMLSHLSVMQSISLSLAWWSKFMSVVRVVFQLNYRLFNSARLVTAGNFPPESPYLRFLPDVLLLQAPRMVRRAGPVGCISGVELYWEGKGHKNMC